MNLWFRLLWIVLTRWTRPKLDVLEESILSFYVSPSDLDIYGHMNNSRYLAIMDLGRMDLVWRSALGPVAKKNSWFPLVAGISIQYKKSLRPFELFKLRTRIVSWDEKWFFLEQRFEMRGRLMAVASVKGLFRGPEGNIPTQKVLKSIDFNSNLQDITNSDNSK